MNDEALRYPTGRFISQESYTPKEVQLNIIRIEQIPEKIERLIQRFGPHHWEIPYRDGGWTARQVIHHMADSHLNAYVRCKWTLTEPTPVIKAYDEKAWAETPETKLDPIFSLLFLKALHIKWTSLLKAMGPEDLKKEFIHPDTKKNVPLDRLVATYAWHGEHHFAHLQIVANKGS
jgi:hypothetical protein